MMSIISGVVVFAVLTSLMLTLSGSFEEELQIRMIKSFAFGVIAGVACALASKLPAVVSIFLLIPVLALMLYLAWYWKENGSTGKEFFYVFLLDTVVLFVGLSAAARIYNLTSTRWVVGIIRCLPIAGWLLSLGFIWYNYLYFKEWLKSDDFDPDKYA